MALTTQVSAAARSAMTDALGAQLNGGYLDIYDGAQPADTSTAVTTQHKLARLALSNPAFAASSAGVATANAIVGSSALVTGTAAWFRAVKTDGSTAVTDGSVGTSGCNLNINSVTIVQGAPVIISSWTLTEPSAGA